jgi:serine/threonine-protein kinase
MTPGDDKLHELARAIIRGRSIDWASVESSVRDEPSRKVIRELKVIADIAGVHGSPVTRPADQPAGGLTASAQEPLGTWSTLRLLEKVGAGAYGEVYRAWDPRLEREVALKLLPASSGDEEAHAVAIIQEGRLLARVRHRNVVTVYGAERIGRRIGLSMEFIEGRTLEQIIQQGGVFSSDEAVDIGIELGQAVGAVHGAGLLHRDIKAHNVMLADDGRLVLMDFGTGQAMTGGSSTCLEGTPLYLAPEVLAGGDASVQSDIYSAGVLLYLLLTGAYPVRASGLADLRLAHERKDRIPVANLRPDIAPGLARIIERAIDPLPARRYPDADALKADLCALKPQPRGAPLTNSALVAAAVILVVTVAWEAVGRQTRSPSTPIRLLARIAGPTPVAMKVSTVAPPVIAVLPLKNLSGEPETDYLVDGLTDEIIRNLAVVQGLHVRSRTSSFAFKDRTRNLREVGQLLGANLVVEGSLLRSGNRLRINAQLIEVANDVPLWAERFDRELDDIFAIQDEIARAIVNKLRLTLGRGQRRYDINVEAYEMYLKGRTLLDRRDHDEDSAQSAQLFQQVLEKDPSFAPAHAGLANAYASMSHNRLHLGMSAEAAHPIMRSAALKALDLDPLLAEAHAAMGYVYSREFDWQNADRSFRRAIELNPTLTQNYTLYSRTTLRALGRLAEAERLLQMAMQADPLSLGVQAEMAGVQLDIGRYDEALETLGRVRAADPTLPWLGMQLGRALTFAARPLEALALFDQSGMPDDSQWRARAFVMSGRRDKAETLAARSKGFPFRLAAIYAALEDRDRTFEALARLADSEPHRVVDLLSYPELAGLAGDPRLAELRKKFNLP